MGAFLEKLKTEKTEKMTGIMSAFTKKSSQAWL